MHQEIDSFIRFLATESSRVSQRRGYNRIDKTSARSERYSQHES